MNKKPSLLERTLPWVVLTILLFFTFVRFARIPYAGFTYDRDGTVVELFVPDASSSLRLGDRIEQVGSTTWRQFRQNLGQPLFGTIQPGENITLLIVRDNQPAQLIWRMPGYTDTELMQRLNSEWWLPLIFWMAGSATLFLIRPKGQLWRLMIAFHYLTALWLAAGGISSSGFWYGDYTFHAAVWLSMPVYLQLHFSYPQPLFSLPRRVWHLFYGIAVILLILDWLTLLPTEAFENGLLIALLGSLLLLFAHLSRATHRTEVKWLLGGFALTLLPAILVVFASILGELQSFQGGAFLGFAALPGVYFVAAYRTQLSALQKRIRRLARLFLILLTTLTLVIIALSFGVDWVSFTTTTFSVGLAVTVLALTVALVGFTPIFALPALAGAYYRRAEDRYGRQMELRINRLFTPYLFVAVFVPLIILFILIIQRMLPSPDATWTITLLTTIVVALVALISYKPFNRFVEQRLFGLDPLPEAFAETYINRLASAGNRAEFIDVLQADFLPTIQVRESVLFFRDETQQIETVYQQALASNVLPQLHQVVNTIEKVRVKHDLIWHVPSDWVQVTIPLCVREQCVGVWLLGQRDPDNLYANNYLSVFEALAAQIAVSLVNFSQTETLQSLIEANIERHEEERIHLARELHDVTLGQLATMAIYVDDGVAPQFHDLLAEVTRHLRQLVSGLRPKMLDYGLWAGLNQLVDESISRLPLEGELLFDLPQTSIRYPEKVEREGYRIVQHALENAIQHAQAEVIRIHGRLDAHAFRIIVEDNGQGFALQQANSLKQLLADGHYGLVGMQERAALIHAIVTVDSTVAEGSCVSLSWNAVADVPGDD
jgi:signal transduction histidine kinase